MKNSKKSALFLGISTYIYYFCVKILFVMKRLCYTLMLAAFMLPAWAQNNSSAQNFSMVSNIDVFSTILKELEMNYVDSLDVKKTVRRGIDAMLQLLEHYTVYFSQDDMGDLKMMTTCKYGGMGSVIRK